MMREILFRGKRTDNGEWIEGSFWDEIPGVLGGIAPYGSCCFHHVNLETVGQFTGLTDCRKEKLFEHDVVTAKFKINGARFNFKIIFKNGSFLFDNGCVAVRFDEIRSAMKIGNIHDTPKLLKGGAKDG